MTDWSQRPDEWGGRKPDTRPGDNLDRAKLYMRWHKLADRKLYCSDADQIEYAFRGDDLVPVAVIELTTLSTSAEPGRPYWAAIEKRCGGRDTQMRFLRSLASRLGAALYYVAIETEPPTDPAALALEAEENERLRDELPIWGAWLNRSIRALWVANILEGEPPFDWIEHSPADYEKFLIGLRSGEERPVAKPKTGDRVSGDEQKLREAVAIFRTSANLHSNSSDETLIKFAHDSGAKRPSADMVRDAWHDYRQARIYAELPVSEGYRITYPRAPELPWPSKPGTETVRDERLHSEPARGQQSRRREGASGEESGDSTPALSCPHTTTILDESERNEVCTECGEVVGCAHKIRVNNGREITCDDCGESLGSAPPEHNLEAARAEPSKRDEDEVLF